MIEGLRFVWDILLHLNVYLYALVDDYGAWVYAILFVIIFLETGLVVAPFLPGDSLLFAAGAIAATGSLSLPLLVILMIVAAVLGDSLNYSIGKFAGDRLLSKHPNLIHPRHLARTEDFFGRHGPKTIVLCRFIPVVRTVAPFLAGAGAMRYPTFMRYNLIGALMWVLLAIPTGYFFADLPFVEKNFSLVLLAVIILSFAPAVVEIVRERLKRPH